MRHSSEVSIDRNAISRNLERIRANGDKGEEVGAVIKADGYGIGASNLHLELERLGVRWFFTFDALQASKILPELASDSRIVILRSMTGGKAMDSLGDLIEDPRIHWTIHDESEFEWVLELARASGHPLNVHLEIDTGMNRGGCDTTLVNRILQRIDESKEIVLKGVCTHFATSDTDAVFMDEQYERFHDAVERVPDTVSRHVSNSHAKLRMHRSDMDLCRIGLAILGYYGEPGFPSSTRLSPALRWDSSICQLRDVKAGESIGYGRHYVCREDMRIGVVPVGYADGYPARPVRGETFEVGLTLEDGRVVYVPIVGHVNMDQITIDLTGVDAEIELGQRVHIYGGDDDSPIHPGTVAKRAGTIIYDILCRLNPYITRNWI